MRRICANLTRTALAAATALMVSAPISAQPYPSKPVKIIVGFAPGGGTDITARFIAQRLSSAMRQQFIVENKPGAGGAIGTAVGVNSPPDGYTLTVISASYTVYPSVYQLKFDPITDITPIIQISEGPFLIVVHPSVPAKTTQELIALAKSRPGKLNFATPGQGGITHLATELFATMAGIKMSHVPYKGTGPALTDTIASHTDLYFSSIAAALPYVKSGRLRALAVTTPKRLLSAPDIPTVAESGVPGYEAITWHGLIGPKGLPSPIVARINGEVTKLLELKETAEQLQNDGVLPAGGTPEQFLTTINKEIQVWRTVVSEVGIKAE
jgi:tripartite-type tricarboxylate transporter receptor subunit TctC